MPLTPRLVVFGAGYTGRATARLARRAGWDILTNVRSSAHTSSLRAEGFDVVQGDAGDPEVLLSTAIDDRTHVLVAFPPSAAIDDALAAHLASTVPRSLVYLSSTGIYGDHRGVVDESTPLPAPEGDPRSAKLAIAESTYSRIGATIFRCAAIYGPDRGLHQRVLRGEHRIPGDGTNFTSRIHVDDLARLILAASTADRNVVAGAKFVVADREPARQIDVVAWICQMYNVSFPPFVPAESVHETLRADRRVGAARIWNTLGLNPLYPTFREGMILT